MSSTSFKIEKIDQSRVEAIKHKVDKKTKSVRSKWKLLCGWCNL